MSDYRFLPWVRQGIASAIPTTDTLSQSGSPVAQLPVSLQVNQRADAPVQVNLQLFGPGDIVGIDPLQVVRTEPPHRTTNVEPNYFPVIEFDRPDFPWLFTPLAANQQGRLRPWLCLVAVRQQPGVSLRAERGKPLPILTIQAPAQSALELPNLAESYLWAHAQVVEPNAAIDALLKANAVQTLSRVLCPRRLQPNTAYYACVVPTFEVGRKAGLGLPDADTDALKPAWTLDPIPSLELPVYYHWEFSTGAAGDFESLAAQLQGRPLPAGVGVRPMAVRNLRFGGFELPDVGLVELEGALRPIRLTPVPPTPIPSEATLGFQRLLNLPLTQAAQPNVEPLVVPPIYGQQQAAPIPLLVADSAPRWLLDLNLDPRYRAIAGLGTQVVQDQQEQLMASAWQQLGDIQHANQIVRNAQLIQEMGRSIYTKHLQPLPAESLLQLTGPIHSRIVAAPASLQPGTAVAPRQTLTQAIRQRNSAISPGAMPLRRVTRPNSPLMRRLNITGDRTQRPTVSTLLSGSSITVFISRPVSRVQLPTVQTIENALKLRIRRPPADRNLLEAALAHQTYYATTQSILIGSRPQAEPVQTALGRFQTTVLTQLDPTITVPRLVRSRVQMPSRRAAAAPTAPIKTAPTFPQPMYEPLRDLSQELLLPGLEKVLPDTVTLVETNPQFVEAYLVGLNHEMGREMLWRECPVDSHETYFQQFWDNLGRPQPDVLPIHQWRRTDTLGKAFRGGAGQLPVLLIRGELLQRYPNAVIYAVNALKTPGGIQMGTQEHYPLFQGTLKPDITFLGFNLSAQVLLGDGTPTSPGYFFVIQQQPTEPRFGLNETGAALSKWSDLAWNHVSLSPAGYVQSTPAPTPASNPDAWTWGLNAAHMASITLQTPVRVAIHAQTLLSLPSPS